MVRRQNTGLGLQQWQVREAVKRYAGSSAGKLARLTQIPREVFSRRLIELQRLGLIARADDGTYRPTALDPATPTEWHMVSARCFETVTHRVRRLTVVGVTYWIAERKEQPDIEVEVLAENFTALEAAQRACDADQYAMASGR